MTRTADETTGGRGDDGDGVSGSTAKGCLPADSPRNTSPGQQGTLFAEQRSRLPISRSVIDSSERPTAVVGQIPSGKSRFTDEIQPDGNMAHFGGDRELAHDFINVIAGKGDSRTPIQTGIHSAYTCLAAKRSAETGRFVDVRQADNTRGNPHKKGLCA